MEDLIACLRKMTADQLVFYFQTPSNSRAPPVVQNPRGSTSPASWRPFITIDGGQGSPTSPLTQLTPSRIAPQLPGAITPILNQRKVHGRVAVILARLPRPNCPRFLGFTAIRLATMTDIVILITPGPRWSHPLLAEWHSCLFFR